MDVVICGGGIVGLLIANLLGMHSELNICVLEPNEYNFLWDQTLYDLRCSAITPACKSILEMVGVWQDILRVRVGQYEQMHIWDQEQHNNLKFNAMDADMLALGYIVENRVLMRSLHNKLQKYKNIRVMHDKTTNIAIEDGVVKLQLTDQTISCKLLIGADGANSFVRNSLNIPCYAKDYNQAAVVATVETQYPHNMCAMQSFRGDETIAFLPLAQNNLCSIVWSTEVARAANLMQLSDTEFSNQLRIGFGDKLGSVCLQGARAKYNLKMQHAKNYVMPNVALLGDAAHVVHPFAGQGLNLGILDAYALHQILKDAYSSETFYSFDLLRKFERARKWHNTSMILGMEMIRKIFSKPSKTFMGIRKLGFNMLNRSVMSKKAIIHYASGISADILSF